MRLVTHHWSDNPLKGFDVYQEVDRLLAAGKLPGVALWVIGRWPKELRLAGGTHLPAGHRPRARPVFCGSATCT